MPDTQVAAAAFEQYRPPPPLHHVIEWFWTYQGYHTSSPLERILPDGTAELVIHLNDDPIRVWDAAANELHGAALSGAYSKSFIMHPNTNTVMLGVHFKPGGVHPFFGLPADELHNHHVALDVVWGRFVDDWREQLFYAKTQQARFKILETALLSRAQLPIVRHRAVEGALHLLNSASRPIKDLPDAVGISSRRLIDVFRQQVGLTPKSYARVQRFQRALRELHQNTVYDWADFALRHGYYDQSHLINEFQSLAGVTPTVYAAGRGTFQNHLAISK